MNKRKNENEPKRAYKVNGWTINFRDGVWCAIDKSGEVQYSNATESHVVSYARVSQP